MLPPITIIILNLSNDKDILVYGFNAYTLDDDSNFNPMSFTSQDEPEHPWHNEEDKELINDVYPHFINTVNPYRVKANSRSYFFPPSEPALVDISGFCYVKSSDITFSLKYGKDCPPGWDNSFLEKDYIFVYEGEATNYHCVKKVDNFCYDYYMYYESVYRVSLQYIEVDSEEEE